MVPTYPKLEPSFMTGLQKVTMTMFNKRAEVEFYEIGVFTSDWNPIPFVSQFKVVNSVTEYLQSNFGKKEIVTFSILALLLVYFLKNLLI